MTETEVTGEPKDYAQPGEVVTCEQGHEVMEVAEPLNPHMMFRRGSFSNWRPGYTPRPGERIDACWCGSPFLRMHKQGWMNLYQVHIKDRGWCP